MIAAVVLLALAASAQALPSSQAVTALAPRLDKISIQDIVTCSKELALGVFEGALTFVQVIVKEISELVKEVVKDVKNCNGPSCILAIAAVSRDHLLNLVQWVVSLTVMNVLALLGCLGIIS